MPDKNVWGIPALHETHTHTHTHIHTQAHVRTHTHTHTHTGPCRDLWRGRCSKYKRGTWNTAFNRAVLLADMCIEMDASVG